MSHKKKTSRRDFLKSSVAAGAGAALAGQLTLARSAHAAGSDVIKVALIGCGGRGTGAVAQQMNADKNVRLIAVADAFEHKALATVEKLKKKYAGQMDVPTERVFSGLNADKQAVATDADLISIATPPGFRPHQYKLAIQANKHVFMEKPCCVDGPGFRSLMETNKLADQKGLFVAVGLQRHHEPRYIETIKRLQDGGIGDILFSRVYWNGQGIWNRTREALAQSLGREPTEMEYQVNNWYHFAWLSGDNITEQHIHNIDVGNWLKDDHPVEANGMGGCTARYLGDLKGTGQIFDHHFVEFTFADGTKMFSQCRHMRGTWGAVSEWAHGSKGSANCSGTIEGENAWNFSGPKPEGHQQEQIDLIAALRAGDRYNEGYTGATSSMTSTLGRLATYSGKVVKWDDAVSKGESEFPTELAMNAEPPVHKDADGDYPIPMPGIYKAY